MLKMKLLFIRYLINQLSNSACLKQQSSIQKVNNPKLKILFSSLSLYLLNVIWKEKWSHINFLMWMVGSINPPRMQIKTVVVTEPQVETGARKRGWESLVPLYLWVQCKYFKHGLNLIPGNDCPLCPFWLVLAKTFFRNRGSHLYAFTSGTPSSWWRWEDVMLKLTVINHKEKIISLAKICSVRTLQVLRDRPLHSEYVNTLCNPATTVTTLTWRQ